MSKRSGDSATAERKTEDRRQKTEDGRPSHSALRAVICPSTFAKATVYDVGRHLSSLRRTSFIAKQLYDYRMTIE